MDGWKKYLKMYKCFLRTNSKKEETPGKKTPGHLYSPKKCKMTRKKSKLST